MKTTFLNIYLNTNNVLKIFSFNFTVIYLKIINKQFEIRRKILKIVF